MLDLFRYGYDYKDEYLITREEYYNLLYTANKYLNHVIYETFKYFQDQLDELDDYEGRLRWTFPEFFVNRHGIEKILQRINSIKDVISSEVYITLDEPRDQFILYYILDNFIVEFREDIENINKNYDKALIEYYSLYCTKNEQINICVDRLTEAYLNHKNDKVEEDENPAFSIYYVCCEAILSEGDLIFDDLDFLPDFLDVEVALYIQRGGNKAGYENNLRVDLYQYTDCMNDVVLEQFIEYQKQFEDEVSSFSLSEEAIVNNIFKSLLSVQENCLYWGKNEDVITDGIRDRLKMVYNVSDQSRCGISESGRNAGEVDLKISDKGMTVTMIEALALKGLSRKELREHIDKILYRYDAIGCRFLFLLIYYKGQNLSGFWKKFLEYISKEYHYPFEFLGYDEYDTLDYTESRVLRVLLKREGIETSLYCIAAKIR